MSKAIELPDNNTIECSQVHKKISDAFKAAEGASAKYKTADRALYIVYNKAAWNRCRGCKSAWKSRWNALKKNDGQINGLLSSIVDKKVEYDPNHLETVQDEINENYKKIAEMDTYWDKFRKSTTLKSNALKQSNNRRRYYASIEEEMDVVKASVLELDGVCQSLFDVVEEEIKEEEEGGDGEDQAEEDGNTSDDNGNKDEEEMKQDALDEQENDSWDTASEDSEQEEKQDNDLKDDLNLKQDHDNDGSIDLDVTEGTCSSTCRNMSPLAIKKLGGYMNEHISDNLSKSKTHFSKAVSSSKKKMEELVEKADGTSKCDSDFCKVTEKSMERLDIYDEQFKEGLRALENEEMTAPEFDELLTEVIFQGYQHEILFWFKAYYVELKDRAAKQLEEFEASIQNFGALGFGRTQRPRGFDFNDVRQLAAGFEHNSDYKKAKTYALEASEYIILFT